MYDIKAQTIKKGRKSKSEWYPLSPPTPNFFFQEVLTIFLYNLSESFIHKEGTILYHVALHLALFT